MFVEGRNLPEGVGVPLCDNAQEPQPAVQGGDRLHHVGLYLLTQAAPLALQQGCQDPLNSCLGRAKAGEGDGHKRRARPSGYSLEAVIHAELGHDYSLVALQLAERAEAAESADRRHDQPGVGAGQGVVGESEGIHRGGTQGVHQNIAGVDQFDEGIASVVLPDVQHPAVLSSAE